MKEKTDITVVITDARQNGRFGFYHNTSLRLFNIPIGKKHFLFCQYGKMKAPEKANCESLGERMDIHAETTGKKNDIILGLYKFRYALNQIGFDFNEQTLQITKYIKPNGKDSNKKS